MKKVMIDRPKMPLKKPCAALLLIASISLLAGCSSMNGSFDCPQQQGVLCKSLDEVNAMVDSGTLGASNAVTKKPDVVRAPAGGHTPYVFHQSTAATPFRQPETVMHVWIAPYEDSAGNYHQDSSIYKVVRPGHWSGHEMPVKGAHHARFY
jgi:conjugal transfer pilus assembly protein TraV